MSGRELLSSHFWRGRAESLAGEMLADIGLRSITPHFVRSRLNLFSNVLIDQKHALAIHNVCSTCSVRKGYSHHPGECGSVHYGFCRAAEEKHFEDVKIIGRQIVEKKKESGIKQSRLIIPINHITTEDKNDQQKDVPDDGSHEKVKVSTPLAVSQSLVSEDGDRTSQDIPPFYFPLGKPGEDGSDGAETIIAKATEYYSDKNVAKLQKDDMHDFTQAIGLPMYWACPLYLASGAEQIECMPLQNFITLWKGVTSVCHDEAARFFKLMARPGCKWLEPEDFVPLIQDVVNSHPGLQFLQDAMEFHSRYVHCVISRIFYVVNKTWAGRITLPELRRSNFLQTLALLEDEEDINQITDFFSYEHFYVIYCKFWELDKDHDLFIDQEDLSRHDEHALSSKIIDRIFSGAVTRDNKDKQVEGKMSYTEFVAFLLSEEDKKTDKSVEYWFRCMDLDGDGVLSMFELQYFYEEQMQRMEDMSIDPLPFNDLLCQMLDLVKPVHPDKITLADLKNCKQAYIFFDSMFHLEKYLDHEQRDPFATMKDEIEGIEQSDWEKYASEEYEILVAGENVVDEEQASFDYEDDFEGEGEEEVTFTPDVNRRDRPKSAKSANSEPQDD